MYLTYFKGLELPELKEEELPMVWEIYITLEIFTKWYEECDLFKKKQNGIQWKRVTLFVKEILGRN